MTTKYLKDHLKTTHSQLEVFRPCLFLFARLSLRLCVVVVGGRLLRGMSTRVVTPPAAAALVAVLNIEMTGREVLSKPPLLVNKN